MIVINELILQDGTKFSVIKYYENASSMDIRVDPHIYDMTQLNYTLIKEKTQTYTIRTNTCKKNANRSVFECKFTGTLHSIRKIKNQISIMIEIVGIRKECTYGCLERKT